MEVKEFGAALFNEYFINETHAIRILESCYGGPTNWSSIEWTKDESGSNDTTADTSSDVLTTLFGESSPGNSDPKGEVPGMTIFWILLAFCLACVYHPLASSIHHRSRFRLYLHVSPFFCILDVLYLVMQCWVIRSRHLVSLRRAAEVVVSYRLKAFLAPTETNGQTLGAASASLPTVQEQSRSVSGLRTGAEQRDTIASSSSMTPRMTGPSGDSTASQSPQPVPELPVLPAPSNPAPDSVPGPSNNTSANQAPQSNSEMYAPTEVVAQAALNIYVRLIADALTMLLYAKLCGFSGIRAWSVLGECLFDSWLLMEMFLFIGYYAAPRNRPEDPDEGPYFSTLMGEADDITSSTEASALTPLFVELSVSFLAIYYKVGIGHAVGSFCWAIVEWHVERSSEYLIIAPFNIASSASDSFFILAIAVTFIPMIVWLLGLQLLAVFAMAAFIAIPICYSAAFALCFGACKRLAKRYSRAMRISDSTLNIACARVLVAIICSHYLVYFLWLYDPQGTEKASWTEMLGRRLG